MQNIFLLIHQKCSKINGANLRPGGLLYYSLCQNNKTFQAWSSLFHKHTPSKILMNKYFHKIVWWFYFNEISNCCFFQAPRLFQPSCLLTLEIFANLLVYCTLLLYYFGRNLPASLLILASPSIWNSRINTS